MKIAAMYSSTPIAARLKQKLATQQELQGYLTRCTLLHPISCMTGLNFYYIMLKREYISMHSE